MSECQGKDSWPELVGAQGTVAEATIERENSLVDAIKQQTLIIFHHHIYQNEQQHATHATKRTIVKRILPN
ncbi:hypothetical protein CerSpe_003340 [Prunus speciosa]